MGYEITHNPDEPIIIAKFSDPFDAVVDGGTVAGYLVGELAKSEEPLYYIADMREITISFSDLVAGLASAYTTQGSPYANPRLQTFTVATDELVALGVKAAAEQRQYGKANVQMYTNVEDALTEINRIISSK